MQFKGGNETRIERATQGDRRKSIRRMVRSPGSTQHNSTEDSPEVIAERIQQAKIERRAKRNG